MSEFKLGSSEQGGAGKVHLFGWDSRNENWHGPNEMGNYGVPDKRMLRALRAAPGNSWYGSVQCGIAGDAPSRFFVMVHNLFDCAVALIYCAESKAGPAEIVAVVPGGDRSPLREDFAFEFLAFARFLGSLSGGAELRVHEAVTAALADRQDDSATVFSISSALWPGELDPGLSCCVEKIALTLCQWLGERPVSIPADCRSVIQAA